MTLQELQALSDEELIELCATKVMRWFHDSSVSDEGEEYNHWSNANYTRITGCDWNPLTDWSHTMELVEKLATGYPAVAFQMYGGGIQGEELPLRAHVKLFNDMDMEVECTDRWQRAIVLASILAVT